jgi:Concanavalin A-like lectin/glucanases superfamily
LESNSSAPDHFLADGKWHHIAVTWRSSDGAANLYDNGRLVWSVVRAAGKHPPSGGTLVIGREQDCEGGCFDSQTGAAGDVSSTAKQEYGSQDFFGVIDELRIWKRVRTGEEIAAGMRASLYIKGSTGESVPAEAQVDPHDPDLVGINRTISRNLFNILNNAYTVVVNSSTYQLSTLNYPHNPKNHRWRTIRLMRALGTS